MNFQSWQRAGILAAVNYLRDLNSGGAGDPRAEQLSQGLLEVLEPARRTARLQREAAQSARSAAGAERERRAAAAERRSSSDRRKRDQGAPGGAERRALRDRRTGGDRRSPR